MTDIKSGIEDLRATVAAYKLSADERWGEAIETIAQRLPNQTRAMGPWTSKIREK